jgi:predicted nucleic acid-binding protein
MSVLIDTSVWSLALRRRRRDLNPEERTVVFRCRDLAIAGETCLIGPILQEVLSGIAESKVFDQIKARLALVDMLPLTIETFTLAAEFFNACRSSGVAPGLIDMMICATAHLHNTPILTADPDFSRYARLLPIPLLKL